MFVFIFLILGALVVHILEGGHERLVSEDKKTISKWSFTNCLYFCMVTLTTVGYGDLTPDTVLSRWFLIFYAMLGLGVVAICLTTIGDTILK